MNKFADLQAHLKYENIPFELIFHKPIFSMEEGLKEIGIEAAQGFSTLIMKADGQIISLIRRDDNKVSFSKIKKLLQVKNLEFATKAEVLEFSGCEVGYVSPFNPGVKCYLDEKLLEQDFVYGGTGSPEHDLKIAPIDLVKLAQAEIINLNQEVSL